MSHEATNWAIKQKGLPPAAKIVLWHLCDRYNPDYGCFPSQHALARDCEISRATLNRHLDALEKAGLIAREARRDDSTFKQLSTRYRLGFESDFEAVEGAEPCRKMRHGIEAETVSQNGQKPCLKSDDSRVSKCDTNPVREPVREPVKEREGVREGERVQAHKAPDGSEQPSEQASGQASGQVSGQEAGSGGRTARQVERRFWRLVKDWPGLDGMPKKRALAAFRALSDDEQDMALKKRDQWFALLKSQGKDFTPAPSTYCAEKLWTDVPEDFGKAGAARADVEAKPFGKVWGAVRMIDLNKAPYGPPARLTVTEENLCAKGHYDRGALLRAKLAHSGWPRVNSLHENAIRRHKGTIADGEAVRLSELFGKVATGSDLWRAWASLHEERGWPWLGPDRDCPDWVYFPEPPEPAESYPDLIEAVRAAADRFRQEHETPSNNEAAE